MAVTVTYGNEELSTITAQYLTDLRSQIHEPQRLAEEFIRGHEKRTGGEKLHIPWEVEAHSAPTQMSTGYEPIPLVGSEIHYPGTDDYYYGIMPVIISRRDEIVNRGSSRIIDRLQSRVKNTEKEFLTKIQARLAGNSDAAFSDLNTLDGINNTGGILEENAVGSQTNTVHSLAKSTYSTIHGFQNQIGDIGGSFSGAGLNTLYDVLTRVKNVTDDPTMLKWYGSLAFQNNLKRALNSQERYLSEATLDSGRPVLVYGSVPIISVDDLPKTAGGSAEDVSAYLIDHSCIKLIGQAGEVGRMGEFRWVSGHEVRACFLSYFMQLACLSWSTSAVIWDGEIW